MPDTQPSANLRNRLWTIIFGTDTTTGRGFDIVLLILILASVLNVMLISVAVINDRFGTTLNTLEWFSPLFSALSMSPESMQHAAAGPI
jgi:voltage-gated potassium channel